MPKIKNSTTTFKLNKYHHERGVQIASYSTQSYKLTNKHGAMVLIPKSMVSYDQQDDGNILVTIPDWLLDSHNEHVKITIRDFIDSYIKSF